MSDHEKEAEEKLEKWVEDFETSQAQTQEQDHHDLLLELGMELS